MMRPAASLSLAVLAACAAADAWWRPAPPVDPAAASAAWKPEPVPSPQAFREQQRAAPREPSRVGASLGPRELQVGLRLGFGVAEARTDHRFDDRADCRFAELRVDAGRRSGIGASVELWSSDDELFEGRRINDGVDPAPAVASFAGADLFVYYHREPQQGDLRLPWRVGAFTDVQRLDHERASVQRDWLSTGVRIIAEPTWRVAGDDARALELVGRFGGDVGASWFEERFRNGSDRDETWRWSADVGLSLRAVSGNVQIEAGYRLTHTRFDAVGAELFGRHDRCDFRRQQFFVGVGVWF
jgi:hypothetical protein